MERSLSSRWCSDSDSDNDSSSSGSDNNSSSSSCDSEDGWDGRMDGWMGEVVVV